MLLTLVLPIVGQDIGAINSINSAILRLGARRIKPNFSSYYLTLSKSQAVVPGGRNSNSLPSAILARWLPLTMRLLKIIRLILTFYRNFFLAAFVITSCCVEIFWKYGVDIFLEIFWFKLFTLALIFYFIKKFKTKEFYYYQNLGVSKAILWITTLTFDLVLFIFLLILTYKIR